MQVVELAPIQKLLPEEVILKVFEQLQPYTLGRVASVCKHWSDLTTHSTLWRAACQEAFRADGAEKLARLLRVVYK